MTERLFYVDSYLRAFSAGIVEQQREGGRVAVTLDRTAFYPSSGGQPSDLGWLGSSRVLDVEEQASGEILHFLEAPLPPGPVEGRIDWERRFDHMQQHSGQHILSQALLREAGAGTVSFHLGRTSSTIDVEIARPSAEQMRKAEALASGIVFEDRPCSILNVAPQELGALGVRKETQREGEIRVVDVAGFDRSPCGGTHVRRTGEIGLISVLGWERYKGITRIEFVCGGRALSAMRQAQELLVRLSILLSAAPSDLPRLVEKLLGEKSDLQREAGRLQQRILEIEALELLDRADKSGCPIIVCRDFARRDLESVKALARSLTAGRGVLAVLSTTGETAQIVVAKSADVPGNCSSAVKQTAEVLGGKGGGRPELAQAGGVPVDRLDAWSAAVVARMCDSANC